VAFELFIPDFRASRIPPGQCAITANGYLLLNGSDLDRVRIKDQVALMLDYGTKRIGLTPPDGKVGFLAAAIAVKAASRSSRRSIAIRRAIGALGLNFRKCKGRYELAVKVDERLLILMPAEQEENKLRKGPKPLER